MHKKIVSFCCFLLLASFSFAQTRLELETQRKRLQKEIIQVNKLLFQTKNTQKNVLEDLEDLNRKVTIREKLIKTINLEAYLLQKKINKNSSEIKKLQKELAALKKDYAAIILKAYKSKSQQSRAMFIFSSQNFRQAYKRLKYMNQYTSFRKEQGVIIENQTKKISFLNDSLQVKKKEKVVLLNKEKSQKKIIEREKKEQEALIVQIDKRKNTYTEELKKKQKDEQLIASRIDKLIRDEIAKANAKKGKKESSGFILSPEAKALATKFEFNKGKLPWPLKSGLITRRFGKQPHPTLGGITINSTGLHFITSEGARAEVVFDGEVLNILKTPEGHKNVLVRHGNYITAYNNLDNVFVQKGQSVKTGQALGEVFTDKVTKKTKLIFVIFKDTKRLNPSSWILKR